MIALRISGVFGVAEPPIEVVMVCVGIGREQLREIELLFPDMFILQSDAYKVYLFLEYFPKLTL